MSNESKKILIADDDQMLVRVLTVRCKELGLDVRSAPDTMFALSLIHKDPPDLILLDVNMPAGNGLAACEMLASDERLTRIPVIVMTGQTDEDIVSRCTAMNARFLHKSPGMWDELKLMLCELLQIDANTAACEYGSRRQKTETG